MELLPQFEKELLDLKQKMFEAQKFAERFPCFSEKILANKFTKEFTGEISNAYRGLYYQWGIKRWFYRDRDNITNYRGDFSPVYLWVIYINQVSVFGEPYIDTGLHDLKNSVDVFFFDILNTTFYATDEQILPLLESLADWYAIAKPINDENRKNIKKRKLQDELDKLS